MITEHLFVSCKCHHETVVTTHPPHQTKGGGDKINKKLQFILFFHQITHNYNNVNVNNYTNASNGQSTAISI